MPTKPMIEACVFRFDETDALCNRISDMAKVGVTGGAGFIGSNLTKRLISEGHEVVVFDDLSTGLISNVDQSKCVFHNASITNPGALHTALKDCGTIIHLAARGSVPRSIKNPVATHAVNATGFLNMLHAAKESGVKRFVYASTVYVNSREGGFYRCSKQAAELYVEEFQRRYGLNYTILRYGSLYGPRADESNGLYKVIKLGIETGILRYEGSVNALREYIHVEDAARASITTLDDQFSNESVILTGHEPMRVLDMLEMIAEIIGLKDAVEFSPQNDSSHYVRTPYAYQPKLGRKLKPAMHVDLGQGLLELISSIQNEIEHDC
jgi:UDP-glucose 4-epimerase